MTVSHIGNNIYLGLAADTKPTNVPTGGIFLTTDTRRLYVFNVTWSELASAGIDPLPLTHSFVVYKDGTTYKAKSGLTGAVHGTTSTTNAALVINAVIADLDAAGGGTIFFAPGTYNIAKTGAGSTDHGVYLGTARNRIAFQGSGVGVTIFLCTEAGTHMFIKNTLNAAAYITFKDLTVDGANISGQLLNSINNISGLLVERTYWTRGNSPGPQVMLEEFDVTIKDSWLTSPNNAGDICALHGKRILVDNCYFTRTVSGGGLTTGGTEETVIRNCQWEGYVGYGAISLEDIADTTENIVIEGNHFFNSAQTGTSIMTTSSANAYNNIIITNNQFEGSGWIVLPNNIHGLTISNNQIWNTQTGHNAIYLGAGNTNVNIHNNVIRNVAGGSFLAAIMIDVITGGYAVTKMVEIHDNIISGADSDGILIKGVKGCAIYNNQMYDVGRIADNAKTGIRLFNDDAGASIRDDITVYNNKFNVMSQANKLAFGISTSSDTTATVIYTNRIPSTSFGTSAITTNSAAGVTLVNGGTV